MVKIMHAADFHLDSRFESLTPEKAKQRRAEQRESLKRVCDLANREQVQIVLLAGDLFDSDNAFFDTTRLLEDTFSKIDAQIFIAPGNHDFYSPLSPYRAVKWPENVHIFRGTKIECVELPELNARVYGAGFVSPSCEMPILKDFVAVEDGMVNLMVLHGDTAAVTRNYNPVYITDIEKSGLDYLALGHVHSFSGIQYAGKTAWAYSGCIEGRGFDELGDKGVVIGNVDIENTDLHFERICLRRCEKINVDYNCVLNGEVKFSQEAREDIYKIVLTGERKESLNLEAVKLALEGKFWHYVLEDKTKEMRDIWAAARQDTLKGAFVRKLRVMYDSTDEKEKKELIETATRYGIAALENEEVEV